jgi:hypothetical protein
MNLPLQMRAVVRDRRDSSKFRRVDRSGGVRPAVCLPEACDDNPDPDFQCWTCTGERPYSYCPWYYYVKCFGGSVECVKPFDAPLARD